MIKRLRSLELQGIKTFATSTRLEFPGFITAIIGPNGSGKSNIADSVRWVLGEQSYSTLRAKRTEDMIFSGSQQRSRSGMASATITFDNEDGWLPIDYSEVSITRRAYRDGQNEYLLNGQKVRLKDIYEILSQTGLSERTYTIIGQGLVDVALALRPDERRELFEEAAGIGLYRSRKEEALRRLDNTHKNLERLRDILTEVKPRLRSLKRQSDRFEEYQQLSDELREHLLQWHGFQWHQKQLDLGNVRKAYHDHEIQLDTLRREYVEAKENVEDARKTLQSHRSEFEEAHRILSNYHHQLEEINRDLAIIDERQRSFLLQKSNLDLDMANLQEEIQENEEQGVLLKKESEQINSEFAYTTDEAVQVEAKLNEILTKKNTTEQQLTKIRTSRINRETQKVQISARLSELQNRMALLLQEQKKINQSHQDLQKDLANYQSKIQELRKVFKEKHQAYAAMVTEVEKVNANLDAFRLARAEIDEKISSQESTQTRIKTQLDLIDQAEAALSGYSQGSKSVVEDSLKGKLPAGIEPLTKHLVVEEIYEKAVSAALGELTDLLIIPTKETSVVIKYLESNNTDRVALVTPDKIQSKGQVKRFLGVEGYIGCVNELIKVDPQYQELVDNLFADTLVVRDRKSALEVQPNLEGTEKVVTLNGFVLFSNGVMISGQSAMGKRLGRTRQQGELHRDLSRTSKKINSLLGEKAKIEESLRSTQLEKLEVTQTLETLEQEKEEKQQALRDAENLLTRSVNQLEWHEERLASTQENVEETKREIGKLETDLTRCDDEIDLARQEEESLQTIYNDLPVFEIQQEFNSLKTQIALAEQTLAASKKRHDDHLNRHKELLIRLNTLQSRHEEFERNIAEISQNQMESHHEIDQINHAMDQIKTERIIPLTSLVEESERKVVNFEKIEDQLHQQVIIDERKYTQLQLELTRKNDQLENLRERIYDDFGLVSFDYQSHVDGPNPLPLGEELIENLPRVEKSPSITETDIRDLKRQVRRMGAINPEAQQEYHEVNERFEFLTNQITDLDKASQDLHQVIETLDGLMARDFIQTFKAVDQEFSGYFSRLFNGGEAKLVFMDQENPVEGGVDIEVRLSGRRQQSLALLSGGERSLTAVALIFALLKVAPTPFCILDEVDAMLDESNIGRFVDLLEELAHKTQFVIITHNRNTVQVADVIYGVTMGRDSTSQMISLKLEDVDEKYLE